MEKYDIILRVERVAEGPLNQRIAVHTLTELRKTFATLEDLKGYLRNIQPPLLP